jgi:hypothetical protein
MPAESTTSDLAGTYARLRPILDPYVSRMQVVQDNERGVYLNTHAVMKNGQPLFFASIAINKGYVSFYVNPVDVYPDLLDDIGLLKKRLQGKSCVNFRSVDDEQLDELRRLVERGYERFKSEGDI